MAIPFFRYYWSELWLCMWVRIHVRVRSLNLLRFLHDPGTIQKQLLRLEAKLLWFETSCLERNHEWLRRMRYAVFKGAYGCALPSFSMISQQRWRHLNICSRFSVKETWFVIVWYCLVCIYTGRLFSTDPTLQCCWRNGTNPMRTFNIALYAEFSQNVARKNQVWKYLTSATPWVPDWNWPLLPNFDTGLSELSTRIIFLGQKSNHGEGVKKQFRDYKSNNQRYSFMRSLSHCTRQNECYMDLHSDLANHCSFSHAQSNKNAGNRTKPIVYLVVTSYFIFWFSCASKHDRILGTTNFSKISFRIYYFSDHLQRPSDSITFIVQVPWSLKKNDEKFQRLLRKKFCFHCFTVSVYVYRVIVW